MFTNNTVAVDRENFGLLTVFKIHKDLYSVPLKDQWFEEIIGVQLTKLKGRKCHLILFALDEFHFRWLIIKGFVAAVAILIVLFFNHLK